MNPFKNEKKTVCALQMKKRAFITPKSLVPLLITFLSKTKESSHESNPSPIRRKNEDFYFSIIHSQFFPKNVSKKKCFKKKSSQKIKFYFHEKIQDLHNFSFQVLMKCIGGQFD